MATQTRPYYLIEVSMTYSATGHTVHGFSCVRKLENGEVSDWHLVGMMLKPKAQRRLTQLNNAFEQRFKQGQSRGPS